METADLMREDGSVIRVDDRISSDGNIGTVKFIGALENQSTKGIWVGVNWDEADRGKHDGSHNGVKYFTTSSPTSGSFVRPKKVSGGISCFLAIKDRYGKSEEENAGVISEELYVVDSKKKKTIVEMVGAESVNLKQSKLNQLQEVVLKDMLVYGVGPHSPDLTKLCSNIRELDLSKNLLPTWERVADIAKCLPQLESLNVSENRLDLPREPATLGTCFSKVKILYMNRMRYSWEEILICSHMFPCLEQLHICFNCLRLLSPPNGQYRSLRLINLESNQLDSWQQILVLNHFSKLESLILNDNAIDSINFPDVQPEGKTSFFPHLKFLCINYNKISQWSSINELNKLNNLQELQITHNPLLETTTRETARQLLIAKIASLKKCNRTEVESKERREAEIDYLKRFGPDWLQAGGSHDNKGSEVSEDFRREHPRYLHFVEAYGAAETSEMNQKPKKLKDSLLAIKITDPDNPASQVLEKKVPATMTIQKLKTLIQRLFKESSREIKLSYVSTKMPGQEIEFENDLKQITFYSVETGDTVYARFS